MKHRDKKDHQNAYQFVQNPISKESKKECKWILLCTLHLYIKFLTREKQQ